MADQGKSSAGATSLRIILANLLAIAGVAILIRGLWMVSPAVALVALGVIMLGAGILARFR